MATLKVDGTGYLVMSDKVTTPSIIIQGVGYIPLFQSNSDTIDYLRYRYTLGNLRVDNYRAAISRTLIAPEDNPEITPSTNPSPTVTIRASSTKVSSGTEVTITAYASGDHLSYEWSNGATSRSIMVSASGTTRYYNCTVYDSQGRSAISNTVKISWYDPMKRNWTD